MTTNTASTTGTSTDPTTTALAMLEAETPMHAIATETGLSVGEIIAAAEAAGLTRKPDLEGIGREIAEALEWGRTNSNRKIQAKAEMARKAFLDLARLRRAETEAAKAAGEIAALKAKLAKAEDRLRRARTGLSSGRAPVAPVLTQAERAACRQWARANGHAVGNHGVIPVQVVTAWQAATRA
jgi:hypothetical protein